MGLELVVTDRLGVEQGVLRGAISDRSITPSPLKQIPTLTFKVRADNSLVPWLALGEKTLVKAYDYDLQTAPLINGPVVAFQKDVDASGGYANVTVAGVGWRAGYRLLGKTAAGWSYGTPTGLVGRGAAMAKALDDVNAESPTGIVRGSIAADVATGYFGPYWEKPLLELWNEIAAPLDGPDWRVKALETPLRSDGAIGQLDIAPAFGSDRPNAVWEFGVGKANVASWSQVINPGVIANRARAVPPGWPDNPPAGTAPQQWDDATSQADRGLFEASIASDIQSDALRLNLAQEHVAIRKIPSQVIAFTPRMDARAPSGPVDRQVVDLKYGTDYAEGDLVRFHALEAFPIIDLATGSRVGTTYIDTVDAVFRLYSITFAYDGQGNRTPSFQLVASS